MMRSSRFGSIVEVLPRRQRGIDGLMDQLTLLSSREESSSHIARFLRTLQSRIHGKANWKTTTPTLMSWICDTSGKRDIWPYSTILPVLLVVPDNFTSTSRGIRINHLFSLFIQNKVRLKSCCFFQLWINIDLKHVMGERVNHNRMVKLSTFCLLWK